MSDDLELDFAFTETARRIEKQNNFTPPNAYKSRPINFIDPAPKPFIVQIPLVEYFERVKRLKADRWQRDFCTRLQSALEQRHLPETERTAVIWALIHAEAQLGKSTILANCFPAWIFGHDPLHKFALATFGMERSQDHSKTVIGIMNMDVHKEIFPNQDGWVPINASKAKWKTNARMQLPEAQFSFNPASLEGGLVGGGFHTLVIDDPYAKEKDAFSVAVRKSLQRFYDADVTSRSNEHSCIFGMFHRYHEEDLAGYLLDTGDFDYWRYASVLDKASELVYIHETTGQRFTDPLKRGVGEYISERRGPGTSQANYYTKKRLIPRIWNSMFLGRPTSTEGDFFKIERIGTITRQDLRQEWDRCIVKVRSWDHAATDNDGDFTVGALMGIQPDGTVIIKDVRLVQMESAARLAFQKEIAEMDGADIPICIPQEVGEAGKTLVFMLTEYLKGYTVIPRHVQTSRQIETSGANPKQRRAFNFSVAVNAFQVKFAEDAHLPEDKQWKKEVIRALRNFGFTTFDDPVDALGDGYNYLFEQTSKGLVIKSQPQYQPWAEPIPIHWTIYIGVKITDMLNVPNSGVIVARAAENSGLTDTLFIVDEYKEHDKPFEDIFTWIDRSLETHVAKPVNGDKPNKPVIYLHPDSEEYMKTIRAKLKYQVRLFDQGDAGIVEANWYVQNDKLIGLGDLPNIKQEAATWGFNERGEPNGIGQVWECLRMITYAFRTRAIGLSPQEQFEKEMLEKGLALDAINEVESEQDKLALLQVRTIESRKFAQEQKPGYKRVGVPNRFRRK